MNTKRPSETLVSDEEKRRAITAAKRKFAARLGVDPDLVDSKISWGMNSGNSHEHERELAKAKGLQLVFQTTVDELLPSVRTQADLDRMVQGFGASEEKLSTMARDIIKQIKNKIPRGGGPGRTPKLSPEESTIVCKEILKLLGKEKYTITKALAEVSKRCPNLLQKKVSPRTLRKAWDQRDEFLPD